MFRPDVPDPYVPGSSKTTTNVKVEFLLSGRVSQPICFQTGRSSALWVSAAFCCFRLVLSLAKSATAQQNCDS